MWVFTYTVLLIISRLDLLLGGMRRPLKMECPNEPLTCQDTVMCAARCAVNDDCIGIGPGPGSCNLIYTTDQPLPSSSGCYFKCDLQQMCDDRYEPCANGATCVAPPNNSDPKTGNCRNPKCICPPGFSGRRCQNYTQQTATASATNKAGNPANVNRNNQSSYCGLRRRNIEDISDNSETFENAVLKCSQLGWRLLEIRSVNDSTVLKSNSPNYAFWIGLSRITGKWCWSSDKMHVGYQNWDTISESNDPNGLYAYIDPNRHGGQWQVALKSQGPQRLRFLCDKGTNHCP